MTRTLDRVSRPLGVLALTLYLSVVSAGPADTLTRSESGSFNPTAVLDSSQVEMAPTMPFWSQP